MSNKYLVKIAAGGVGGAMAGAYGALTSTISAAGRVAGKGLKAFGNQVHLSSGGAFKDHAMNAYGIKDPSKLMKFNGSRDGLRNLRNASVKAELPVGASKEQVKEHLRNFRRKTVPKLQNKQMDARIVTGATVGTAAALTLKAKEKLSKRNDQATYYQQY